MNCIYEPDMDLCLMMMHISRERTILVCYQFLKELRKRFGRKRIFTDGGRWYKDKDACKWLRLKHQVYSTELKNVIMERIIQKIIEDRTECFIDDHFPYRSESCNRQQHVTNWIKMFILICI
jgi:transposase-like protein